LLAVFVLRWGAASISEKEVWDVYSGKKLVNPDAEAAGGRHDPADVSEVWYTEALS
jgi:hypothetical protein